MQAAGLTDTVGNVNATITLLAPSNAAFAKIPEEELNMVLGNKDKLTHVRSFPLHPSTSTAVVQRLVWQYRHVFRLHIGCVIPTLNLLGLQMLKLHVIPGIAPASLLKHGEQLSTLAGVPVTVTEAGSNTKFSVVTGGSVAAVTTPDILSCKGVVHIIDTVLKPPKKLPPQAAAPAETTPAAAAETPSAAAAETPSAAAAETPPAAAAETPPVVTTTPVGRPNHSSGVKPGPDGKWSVCYGNFGKLTGTNACGVRVRVNGQVTIGEYFGGFDGYFSLDPSDAHENCFNRAVARMFEQQFCEYTEVPLFEDLDMDGKNDTNIECQLPADGSLCVCQANTYGEPAIKGQRGNKWPGNQGVSAFLKLLRDNAAPVNYDYPGDIEVADNGGRQENQRKVEEAFTALVNVVNCSKFE